MDDQTERAVNLTAGDIVPHKMAKVRRQPFAYTGPAIQFAAGDFAHRQTDRA